MSLDFIFSQPPGGGGDYGIENADITTLRNELVAGHTIGTGEAGFIGFASRVGFSTTTVTTANGLISAISGMSVNQKLIIKCQWNGVSNPTGTTNANGPLNTAMTANGAVDWGYNRPDWSCIIEPDTGYAPEVGVLSASSINFVGCHWLEINDMIFSSYFEFTRNTGTRAGIAIAAMTGCHFKGRVDALDARTMHLDTCKIDGINASIRSFANYTRIWTAEGTGNSRALDFITNYSYDGYKSAWRAHTWISNTILHSMPYGISDANHFDFYQTNTGADTHLGYNVLVEFCIINANGQDSQGVFGDDISSTAPQTNNMLFHNNLCSVNAYEGYHLFDPSGNGKCAVYRCGAYRAEGAGTTDTEPRITIEGNNINGTGYMKVLECYCTQILQIGIHVSSDVELTGNLVLDPKRGADGGPTSMTNRVTGTINTLNPSGFWQYTITHANNYAAAKTAIAAFLMPKTVGWRGASCGPVDPATWPAAGT